MQEIEFDLSLYNIHSIYEAINLYSEIAIITIVHLNASTAKCIITESKTDLQLTKAEFSNCVLQLSFQAGKQWNLFKPS